MATQRPEGSSGGSTRGDSRSPGSRARTTARIGVTTSLETARTGPWERPAALVPGVYLDAVADAGGAAVLLPPQPPTPGAVQALLDGVDALVLTGGADVDPAHYRRPRHPRTAAAQPERDAWELALVRAALERDLPLLGVCRGLQVLNTALGGTLHQHLPDVVGHEGHQPEPARFGTTTVALEAGSHLGQLLGGGLQVHCHHHQGVDEAADGLRVVARAEDGVVEAVEVVGAPFALAVQWHTEEDRHDRRLVAALVAAAVDQAAR